ncbi:MAG: hypothetical protein IIB38_03605 [Candidatus Hydrogenedentes bacterium]|nr:hypothetical protein [Candidatus Hydrogenedentota bacterium]
MQLTVYIGVGIISYALFAGLVARLWEAMGHGWDWEGDDMSDPGPWIWPLLLIVLLLERGFLRPLKLILNTTYRLTRGGPKR